MHQHFFDCSTTKSWYIIQPVLKTLIHTYSYNYCQACDIHKRRYSMCQYAINYFVTTVKSKNNSLQADCSLGETFFITSVISITKKHLSSTLLWSLGFCAQTEGNHSRSSRFSNSSRHEHLHTWNQIIYMLPLFTEISRKNLNKNTEIQNDRHLLFTRNNQEPADDANELQDYLTNYHFPS